jgi:hypothetical protein
LPPVFPGAVGEQPGIESRGGCLIDRGCAWANTAHIVTTEAARIVFERCVMTRFSSSRRNAQASSAHLQVLLTRYFLVGRR